MALKLELGINKEKIEKLTPVQRWLISFFVMVVFVVLAIFLLYLPTSKKISEKEKVISKLEEDLTAKQQIAQNLEVYKQEYEKLTKRLEEYIKKLPSAAEVEKVMVSISSIGKEVNVDFLKFVPKPDVPGKEGLYFIVPIDTEISGKFHSIAIFMDRVAKMDRIVKPVDFTITPVEDKEGNVFLNVKLAMETYKYREPVTSPAPAQKGPVKTP